MPKIIKDGKIIDNDWIIVVDEDCALPTGNLLVSLNIWRSHKNTLLQLPVIGLFLHNDQYLEDISDELTHFSVIAIYFPEFIDGRGFSLSFLLRDRYHYKGEVRATGTLIRDQLFYLKRCGVNSFDFGESVDLQESLNSLNDFTESYQMSVDQKIPLFRRRT